MLVFLEQAYAKVGQSHPSWKYTPPKTCGCQVPYIQKRLFERRCCCAVEINTIITTCGHSSPFAWWSQLPRNTSSCCKANPRPISKSLKAATADCRPFAQTAAPRSTPPVNSTKRSLDSELEHSSKEHKSHHKNTFGTAPPCRG